MTGASKSDLRGCLRMRGFDGSAGEAVFSGASGLFEITAREAGFLKKHFPAATLRGYTGISGHAMEANFTLGLALAALSLDKKAVLPVFNGGIEQAMSAPAEKIAVTTVGLQRGEGVAVLTAEK